MNSGIYRLVFNASRGLWMVVSEHVRSHQSGTNSTSRSERRLHLRAERKSQSGKSTMYVLLLGMVLSGNYTLAFAGTLAADTVPTNLQAVTSNITIHAPVVNPLNAAGKALNIDQSGLKGIIQGTNFNIGSASAVNLNHSAGNGSATLIRINGPKSVIEGALNSPNGKVYLINQNGILFANGSRVNTNGLVATALDMADTDFLSNLGDLNAYNDGKRAAFVWGGNASGFQEALIQVEPDAQIKAALGSNIMMFAPKVINQGSLETTEGQVVMAAGEKVYLSVAPQLISTSGDSYVYTKDSPYRALAGVLVEVDSYKKKATDDVSTPNEIMGQVTNDTSGRILAQRGNVTLAGFMVNQEGRITATSSVSQKGSIRLLARDTASVFDANDKNNNQIVEPVAELVDGKLPNGNTPETYDLLVRRQNGSVTTVDNMLIGSRTGQLNIGENSITTVLAEDSAALPKAKELFATAQVGEPIAKAGEKSYVEKVLAAVNVKSGTVTDDQIFSPPTIEAVGRQVTIGDNAKIVVPGGYVNISAQKNGGGFNPQSLNVFDAESRLYLGKNAQIDVAGLKNVEVNVERNFVEQLLTLTDLKDDPINKEGFLYRQKVWYDIRNLPDSKVADLAGYLKQVPRSLGEKLATGGSVKLKSEGDLIQSSGSKVDVSGGTLKYNAGLNKETWLVTANGKSYALGDAPTDTLFTGFLGGSNSLQKQERGYTEGKSAGSIELTAVNMALDGQLTGGATYGEKQRESANLGGKLAVNVVSPVTSFSHDINITNSVETLGAGFNAEDSLPQARVDTVALDAGMLNRSGFEEIKLDTSAAVKVNAELNLVDGAKFNVSNGTNSVSGNEINKSITAHGGTINITKAKLAEGVKLDVSGNWVNDTVSPSTGRVIINGGKVSADLSEGVGKNTLLDVSGGGWLKNDKKIAKGNAGEIKVTNAPANLITDTELRGYALGTGGYLSVVAPYMTIGAQGFGDAGELVMDSAFFQRGGFTRYDLTGINNIVVRSSADVEVKAQNYVLNQDYSGKVTGAHLYDFATTRFLPDYLRTSTSIALSTSKDGNQTSASGILPGSVVVETGAKLAVDANGLRNNTSGVVVAPSITLSAWNNQLYVDGALSAPGGLVQLTMNGDPTGTGDTGYNEAQSIWLGKHATLSTAGYAQYTPNANGLKQGNVYDGGEINIDAKKGYVVAEAGSNIDVSGVSATFDVKNINQYKSTKVAGNAGAISISAREGMLLDSDFNAKSDGGLGGSLELKLTRSGKVPFANPALNAYPGTAVDPTLPDGYLPNQLWYMDIAQTGNYVPANLNVGNSLKASAGGLAKVSVDRIAGAGFADVALKSEDGIRFNGNVNLASSRSLKLDARVVEATPNSLVNLTAPNVVISDDIEDPLLRNSAIATTPVAGSANLQVNAKLLDVKGSVALSGFASSVLNSTGDVRLTGVNTSQGKLKGELLTTGELTFNARQIYPTTFSDFDIKVSGAGSKVTFNKVVADGGYDQVLSAAGKLTVQAETINQNCVLLAPFGTIALEATDTLNLNDGSVTSVSAQNMLIPFGYTDRAGLDYLYNYGTSKQAAVAALSAIPERNVIMSAPNVNENEGSTVDVSGGGDLFAYEWIKGLGGSADVLANGASQGAFGKGATNTWAIMPANNQTYASYDTQYWAGSNIKAGDAVYLSGVSGLADGYYTLMPARYALLPGAMLVSEVSGYQDRTSGLTQKLDNGSSLVSGHLAAYTDNGYVQTSRTGGFVVRAGTDAHKLAQYNTTTASDHFKENTQAQQTIDAGRVSIAATQNLVLKGAIDATVKAGGKGAELDIAAPKLLISDSGAAEGQVTLDGETYLAIDESTLTNFNVASLLLGGTRSNGNLAVVSSEVRMGQNASLSGKEVILAATDKVRLESGAQVKGTGDGASNRDLTIGNVNSGVDGDGALLRVSGGKATQVTRVNTDNNRGDIIIDSGATVAGDGSVLFDASRGYQVSGDVKFAKGAALGFSSRHISLGSPDNKASVTDGLWLTKSQLDNFVNAGSLLLNSKSTVDFFGDITFGSSDFDLTIQSAGIAGYQNTGKTATINAKTFTLSNKDNSSFAAATPLSDSTTPQLGTGELAVNATNVVVGDNSTRIAGYDQVNIRANKEFLAKNQTTSDTGVVPASKLETDGSLALNAGQVTVAKNNDFTLEAGASPAKSGVLKIGGVQGVQAAGFSDASSQSAKLKLSGDSVIIAGGTTDANNITDVHAASIVVKGGQVIVEATGANPTDNVTIESGATINVQGKAYTLNDRTVNMSAGKVKLISKNGDVDVKQDAVIDLSAAGSGDAGQFIVSAVNGEAKLSGTVKAAEIGVRGKNAQAMIDAKKLNFNQAINTLSTFSGSQSYRVREGDITVLTTDRVAAQEVKIEASNGAIIVNGTIDASADKGGSIGLYAKNDLTVNSGAQLLAKGLADKTSTAGSLGDGGEVVLSSQAGTVLAVAPDSNGQGGALIDVGGDQVGNVKGDLGQVTFRAADLSKIDAQSSGAVTGAKQVSISPITQYNTTSLDAATMATINGDVQGVANSFNSQAYHLTRDGKSVVVRPEAEVISNSNLTVANSSVLGSVPGVLTLKAAQNLNVNGNIDALDAISSAAWNIRLVAGADASSVNSENVLDGVGDVVLKNASVVRTGTGFIHVAAGNDVKLGAEGSAGAAIYTKGTDTPDPQGFTRLTVASAKEFYGTAGGDIKINAGGSVTGSKTASTTQDVNSWLTHAVNNDNNINGQARWWSQDIKASSTNFSGAKGFTNGIGTLGGGDVTINATGNLSDLQIASATNGRMGGSKTINPDIANFSELGGGDLSVKAGGSVSQALLHAGHGKVNMQAGGDLGVSLSLMDSNVDLVASGNLNINSVSNPTSNASNLKQNGFRAKFYTYDDKTSVSAVSLVGNTKVEGKEGEVLPANLYLASPNGNVDVSNVVMYPSKTGSATILAGSDVKVSNFVMSDVNPAKLAVVTTPNIKSVTSLKLSNYNGASGHTEGLLHLNDAEPLRIYAENDVIFKEQSPVVSPKLVSIQAGHDIVNPNLVIQNNKSTDVSLITAGNDVRYITPEVSSDGTFLSIEAGIQIAGPGRLHVAGGRDVDLGTSYGILSVGNSSTQFYNPYLPEQGADLMVQAGAAGKMDYDAMISAYLERSSPYSSLYLPQLPDYMDGYFGTSFTKEIKVLKVELNKKNALLLEDITLTSQQKLDISHEIEQLKIDIAAKQAEAEVLAFAQFKTSNHVQQTGFINNIYFNELKVSGRNAIDPKNSEYGDYSRAERAILTMFPDFAQPSTTQSLLAKSGSIMDDFAKIVDEPVMHPGDLSLFYSQIRSERGGRIELLVPGGMVNAGLEVSGGVKKSDADLGILSLRGGELWGMVRDDFQVNQSRVFTLGGSDLMLYSALADIDAGKGAKTASSTPPPVIRIVNGQVVFDYSGAVTGSGIAALTSTGGDPGTVDLFAPYGEINAGEAGIRSAGNINLGARVIVGADNISAGGVTSGVPAVSAAGLSVVAPASADTSATGKQNDQLADSTKQDMGNKLAALPSIINVEVISLGDDTETSKSNKKSCDKSDKNRKDCAD